MKRVKVRLVHQGVWDMEKLSMPLALGYLKATALTDERIREHVDIKICNFGGGHEVIHMLPEVVISDPPDILAFSVFGWNFRNFCAIAETFKQLNPKGLVIFGGTHVSHQAERVFRLCPEVDLVVNGEGESTFRELLGAYLDGAAIGDLGAIAGLSFRDAAGQITTTPDRPRLRNLDEIPSPFLDGSIPLVGEDGEFLYDAVTMETNRGCPYSCSFCYWGGATGTKIFKFSRERLRAELELFGKHRIANICLADANFGMLADDEEFLTDFLEVRARYGYPRSLVASWAKNKNKIFYRMLERMKETGLHADVTLALQTLTPAALVSSKRTNMKINEFTDLCEWLRSRGLTSYVELIWGLPGDTYETFLHTYDEVAKHTHRIATYTNLMLPNTSYDRERKEHAFVTFRGADHDYEYILSHATASFEDNQRMHGFMFWARLMCEFMVFECVLTPLRKLADITQSQLLFELDRWILASDAPAARGLRAAKDDVVRNLDTSRVYAALRIIRADERTDALLVQFWAEAILPRVPAELRDYFEDLFRYDLTRHPIHDDKARREGLRAETIDDSSYYVRSHVVHRYDHKAILEMFEQGRDPDLSPSAHVETYYYLAGFANNLDNHEVVIHHRGRTLAEFERDRAKRQLGHVIGGEQMHVAAMPDRSKPKSDLIMLGKRA